MKYNVFEISEAYKIGISTIRQRARSLGIKPILFNKRRQYLFSKNEILKIVNYGNENEDEICKIIYITQTFYIFQSKMNFI